MKEIKYLNKWRPTLCLEIESLKRVTTLISPKLIHKFGIISIKTLAASIVLIFSGERLNTFPLRWAAR